MKEYLAYTQKNSKDTIVTAIAGFVFLIVGLAAFRVSMLISIVLIVLGLLSLFSALTQKSRNRNNLSEFESGSNASIILADFSEAVSVADDLARIGQKYLYRSKYPQPIAIADLLKAEYSEGLEVGRDTVEAAIYLTLKNGKHEKLCNIYGAGYKEIGSEILQMLKERNPEITIRE